MQSDYDAVTRNCALNPDTTSRFHVGTKTILTWLFAHQKTVLISVFCLFLSSYFLASIGSLRHLSMSSLAILSLLCSVLLALGYANFGKTLPRLKPNAYFWTEHAPQTDVINKTDFTIQPWSLLLDGGLTMLAQRFTGRLTISALDERLVWVNMSAFYGILEVLIERILARPDACIRIALEQDYASLPYRCLVLDIFGAEQAGFAIETLFTPADSSLLSEQRFLYARQFMQQARGKLLYKSDLRKECKITFLFPKVE